MQSFLVIQSRMQFEGGEMIVIAVQPVKQVIYFFFISLKLCNTEQYRMWHWRLLSSSHLRISIHSSSSIFQSILINRTVINSLMHTFLIWCNKSCSISWRNFNTSNLNPPPPQLGFGKMAFSSLAKLTWGMSVSTAVDSTRFFSFYETIKVQFYLKCVKNHFAFNNVLRWSLNLSRCA